MNHALMISMIMIGNIAKDGDAPPREYTKMHFGVEQRADPISLSLFGQKS